MTLILAESFDGYGPSGTNLSSATDESLGKWGGGSAGCLLNNTNPLHGLSAFATGSSGEIRRKKLLAADEDDYLVIGAALRFGAINSNSTVLELRSDASNVSGLAGTVHITFAQNGSGSGGIGQGSFNVWRGAAGSGTLLGTTPICITINAWYYFELAVRLHDSAGTVDVWVDGVNVLSVSGVDTKNGGTKTVFDSFGIFCSTPSPGPRWDDIYVLNEQGSAPFNARLGPVAIDCLGPTGDGNSSQGLGSDGNSASNYALVDDGADGTAMSDADYVDLQVTGDKDTYAFENTSLPATGRAILGVAVYARAIRTDAGARTLALVARSGGSESDSADQAIPAAGAAHPEFVLGVFATKPGGGAWSFADVDGAEFGVKARP